MGVINFGTADDPYEDCYHTTPVSVLPEYVRLAIDGACDEYPGTGEWLKEVVASALAGVAWSAKVSGDSVTNHDLGA